MSLTYQPKSLSRRRKHGFLRRMRSADGRNLINRKRKKMRKCLGVKCTL